MRSFIKFNKGFLKMPLHWQPWLLLLVTLNLIIPLFFLGQIEAQVVLATMLLNVVVMTLLTGITGFTRLLGLGHFPWFVLLYFLWTRLEQVPAGDFFGNWIRVLMLVNALSLILDVVDVARYMAGAREETVAGL